MPEIENNYVKDDLIKDELSEKPIEEYMNRLNNSIADCLTVKNQILTGFDHASQASYRHISFLGTTDRKDSE